MNSSIATILVMFILSKSQYQKVIILSEVENNKISIYSKVIMYIQISIASIISVVSFHYMSLDPGPESCLSNLAGLLVLNEFDNIVGFVFEFRVTKKFPRLQMLDDLLKDEFKLKS